MILEQQRQREIVVTETDRVRLGEMIRSLETVGNPFQEHVRELEEQVLAAKVMPATEVSPDVVTMNSQVRVKDVDTGRTQTFTLVYHGQSGLFDTRLSVLTPLGTAALGARAGDVIEWTVPRGIRRRLRIEQVVYQPEAAGDLHL